MNQLTTFQTRWQTAVETPFVLLCGGVLYYAAEILARGHSHWSMAVCGGICFWFVYRLCRNYPRVPLFWRALAGGIFITVTELFAGCLLNIALGMEIWDYSTLPYHFLGQICLSYSIGWFLLCFPVCGLARLIRKTVFYAES